MQMEVDTEICKIEFKEEKLPSDVEEEASEAVGKLLPEKSRIVYEKEYKCFQNWKSSNNIDCVSEDVLLTYFSEKSKKVSPSTLWSYYSMLKCTLLVNENCDISKYSKLIMLLKKLTDGYKPKKSRIFELDDAIRFLKEAPDDEYLFMKVVAIMGLYGACRSDELYNLEISNVDDRQSVIVVSVTDTKTKKDRSFCITDKECGVSMLEIVRKYIALRPKNVPHKKFFINYRHKKCTIQPVGINTMYKVPKKMADFLKLPNSEMYTGHCFRRSAATIMLTSSGADLLTVKREIEWESPSAEETYIDDSVPMDEEDTDICKIEIKEEKLLSDMKEEPSEPVGKLLSEKSRMIYEKEYKCFQNWKTSKNIDYVSEMVLVSYFLEKSKKVKPPTLWSYYSMLKSTLLLNENCDISKYSKVITLLKKLTDGYKPKKSKIFEPDDAIRFLKGASDDEYLFVKVVAIMGLYGACRSDELYNLEVSNVDDRQSVIVVSVTDTRTKKDRSFCIIDKDCGVSMLETVRKYMALRPSNVPHKKFFINYRHKKCTIQPVGINTLCKVPKKIAEFLKLPNSEMYTGHCFRRSAATMLTNSGADLSPVKCESGSESSFSAETYVEASKHALSGIEYETILMCHR